MIKLFIRQLLYENRIFWRNTAAAFFTVALPVIFLIAFWFLFSGSEFDLGDGDNDAMFFYIPALCVFSVVGACFTNIAMTVVDVRDRGLFKRFKATPLPLWIILGAKITFTALLGLFLVLVVQGLGVFLIGVRPQIHFLPHMIVVLLIGSAAFCALGLALTTVIPNSRAAPAIVQGTVLPLFFISDIYFPMIFAPEWLQLISNIFPIRHMSLGLQQVFNPDLGFAGFEWRHLIVLTLWGLVGMLIALRFFRWEPKYG